MVPEAKAVELIVVAQAGLPAHLSPALGRNPQQVCLQLLVPLGLLLPPFIISDAAPLAQQVGIPVVAATDAAVAGFDGADRQFHLIVGARQAPHIVTAGQPRPQPRQDLEQMPQAALLLRARPLGLQSLSQLPKPLIEPTPDFLTGDLLRRA
jgi:hypothetical protein